MRFLIYSKMYPFPGCILQSGFVDVNQKPDGSTMYEYIQRALERNPDIAVALNAPLAEGEKKYDPKTKSIVDLDEQDITPGMKRGIDERIKQETINQKMPSHKNIQDITNIEDVKAVLEKLRSVVYALAKGEGLEPM